MSREQPQWVEVRVPCPHGEVSHWLDVPGTVIRKACVGKNRRFDAGDVRGVLDLMGVEAHQIEVVDSGPREDGYGGWVQEEPHIVSSVIEPARCHLKRGTYFVVRVEGD